MKNKTIPRGTGLLLVSILITTMSGCGTASFNSGSPFVIFEKSHTTSIPELEVYASKIESTSSPSVIKAKTKPDESDVPAAFKACSITTDEMDLFQYWLYTPANPTENMPLIVYLHGASGKGDDLNLITSADDFPKYLQSGEFGDVRAYVIIPQLSSTQKGWSSIDDSLYSLIRKTVSEFSIDENNISLAGFSMGGTGTWNFVLSYPTLFARIAPLSGSAKGVLKQVSVLNEIPVWAFVGSADTVIPPNSSEDMVFALKKAGGTAYITVFDSADHVSVPSLTWLDETINLVDWLINLSE